jgi:mRNA interferase RelE/StbE
MSYIIHLTRKANKFLKSCNEKDVSRFKKGFKELLDYYDSDFTTNSNPDIKKLRGKFAGTFRLRIGQYRAIFRISSSAIVIIDIKARSGAYK